jgi:hypothetical protein
MSENIPITFAWRRQLQEADWPERKRKSVMAVAFILEDYADPDGQNVYPANDTIAFKAGMNIKTVRDVLRLMTENRFLRRVGKARYGQSKYRLIYPALPVETYLQRPTNTENSKTPTNRTESPTDDDSSPDGDIVASSANTERSVSVPSVEVEESVLERNRLEFLRPFFERSERVSYPETREISREYSEQGFDDEWCDFTRTEVFSDFQHFLSKTVISCSYTDAVEVMSGESSDKDQITEFNLNSALENMAFAVENTLEFFIETYCLWRSEKESGWMLKNKYGVPYANSNELGWDLHFGYSYPESSNGSMVFMSFSYLVEVVRDLLQKIDDSRGRVMAIRAKAESVSVSATNTGSDASIVERIVETVSEKVDERW